MACPSLNDLEVTLPTGLPPKPALLQAGDFDYTIDNGGFADLLASTVGNAGDSTDGVDALISETVLAVDALEAGLSAFDSLLDLALSGLDNLPGLDAAAIAAAADRVGTTVDSNATDLGNQLAGIPSAGTGGTGPGTGPGTGGGPPAGFTDQIDFGVIKAGAGGLGNSAKVNYVYEPHATAPYTLQNISSEGSAAFQFSYGSFPVRVTVGKPPVFGVWVQNILPGEYTGALDIHTDEKSGGGRVFLHVIVTK